MTAPTTDGPPGRAGRPSGTAPPASGQALLTSREVAALFGVDFRTVTRWTAGGKLASIRTPGGHHRYRRADVDRMLSGLSAEDLLEDATG